MYVCVRVCVLVYYVYYAAIAALRRGLATLEFASEGAGVLIGEPMHAGYTRHAYFLPVGSVTEPGSVEVCLTPWSVTAARL